VGCGVSVGDGRSDALGEGLGVGTSLGMLLGAGTTDGSGLVPTSSIRALRASSPSASAPATARTTTPAAAAIRAGTPWRQARNVAHHPIGIAGSASIAVLIRAARSIGGSPPLAEA